MTETDKHKNDAYTDPSLLRCVLKKSGHTAWYGLLAILAIIISAVAIVVVGTVALRLFEFIGWIVVTIINGVAPTVAWIITGINGMASWILSSIGLIVTTIPLWGYIPILAVVGIILHSAWWCLTRGMVLIDEDWKSDAASSLGITGLVLTIFWFIFFAGVGILTNHWVICFFIAAIPLVGVGVTCESEENRVITDYPGAVINWYNRTHGME